MAKFRVLSSTVAPVPSPAQAVSQLAVPAQPAAGCTLSLAEQLQALTVGLSAADVDLILSVELAATKKPDKILGKKAKQPVEPLAPLPPMYIVSASYTCKLCGSSTIQEYKCTKEEPIVTEVVCNWCPECLDRLGQESEQARAAIKIMWPIYKKQVTYSSHLVYAGEG